MTLNDFEQRNSPYFVLRFSLNSIALLANYVTVVELPIMSIVRECCLEFQSSTFGHN